MVSYALPACSWKAKPASTFGLSKYYRNLEDVFEVQDEITANIAGALEPQLAGSGKYSVATKKRGRIWTLGISSSKHWRRIAEFLQDRQRRSVGFS